MSARYIFSYFDALPSCDMVAERILVTLWRQAWTKAGLTPIVLSEWWAAKHPIYHEFDQAVSKLPSTNPANYDRSCFIRWLAVQVAAKEYPNASGRIVMADYDTWAYPDIPDVRRLGVADLAGDIHTHWHNLMLGSDSPMLSLHGNCPALVIGTEAQFAEVCQWFLDFKPPAGLTHTSDMYLFEQMLLTHPEKFKTSFDVIMYGEPGWEKAAAVHYANAAMMPAGKTPKWQHIPTLRT